MIVDLKPYLATKDSGLPWAGKIPKHWGLTPNRALMRKRKILVGDRHTDYKLLSLTKRGVIVRDVESGAGKFSADMGTSQEVRSGDLIFCLFDVPETPRTVGLSSHDGMITGAYTIFECDEPLCASFIDAFYRAMDDRKLLSPLYSGLRNTIPPSRLLSTKTPLPPPDEQAAIVRYLDYANRRVRRFIRTKQKLIALLTERKQAIIHRTSTRGLNPDVQLKDSGVEWLGDVPAHWEVVRCGYLIELATGFPFKSEGFSQSEDDIRLLRGVNISPGRLRWDAVVRWPANERSVFSDFELARGDIVLGMDRPIIREGIRVAEVAEEDLPCLLLQRVARIRPLDRVDSKFLLILLAGNSFGDYLAPIFTGISVPHLSPEQIRSFRLALPPLDEQIGIVEYLDGATADIDTTIARARREIELLSEYRTRITFDVATGKLDVREAVASLPAVDLLDTEYDMDELNVVAEETDT